MLGHTIAKMLLDDQIITNEKNQIKICRGWMTLSTHTYLLKKKPIKNE